MSHDCGTRRACAVLLCFAFMAVSNGCRRSPFQRLFDGPMADPPQAAANGPDEIPPLQPVPDSAPRPQAAAATYAYAYADSHTRHNLNPASALGPAASRDLSPEPDRGEDIGTGARRRNGERPRITRSRFHPLVRSRPDTSRCPEHRAASDPDRRRTEGTRSHEPGTHRVGDPRGFAGPERASGPAAGQRARQIPALRPSRSTSQSLRIPPWSGGSRWNGSSRWPTSRRASRVQPTARRSGEYGPR